MDQGTTDRILIALYRLSRDTCPIDATALARAIDVRAIAAAQALIALERAGLADATRARLTLFGLARAVRLDADTTSGPMPLRAVRARTASRTRITSPLAASETQPPPPDENDDPLRDPDEGGSEEIPLEQPLRKPLYRPLRKPIYGQRMPARLH